MLRPFVRRHAQGLTYAGLVLACLLMLAFSSQRAALRPKEIGLSVASVFQSGVHGVGKWISGTVNAVGELRRLRSELDELRQQVASYERSLVDVNELQLENASLRDQLGLSKAFPYPQIPAEVIAVDPAGGSTIIINKGARQGVERGMAVVAFQNGMRGLVGRVVAAGAAAASVMPVYDVGSYVSGRHQGSRYQGIVQGRGLIGGTLVMSLVPKAARAEIGFGDLILTSGLGGVYPKGLNVGRVEEVVPRRYEESLDLVIEPIIDFSRIEYVFVLKTDAADQDVDAGGQP
jgi:rod shape-determining protein MreC